MIVHQEAPSRLNCRVFSVLEVYEAPPFEPVSQVFSDALLGVASLRGLEHPPGHDSRGLAKAAASE